MTTPTNVNGASSPVKAALQPSPMIQIPVQPVTNLADVSGISSQGNGSAMLNSDLEPNIGMEGLFDLEGVDLRKGFPEISKWSESLLS